MVPRRRDLAVAAVAAVAAALVTAFAVGGGEGDGGTRTVSGTTVLVSADVGSVSLRDTGGVPGLAYDVSGARWEDCSAGCPTTVTARGDAPCAPPLSSGQRLEITVASVPVEGGSVDRAVAVRCLSRPTAQAPPDPGDD